MLAVLAGTASPHGGERPLAETFTGWAAQRWPRIDWSVRPLDNCSASVLAASDAPAELVIYSHLDTSLTGDPDVDAPITGCDDPSPAYRYEPDAGTVSGFGLGVAKAPAAAAIVGFTRAAARVGSSGGVHLLLAAKGTHRTDWSTEGTHRTGASEYLATLPRPRAAVVAKGGPPGILRQEPAALYLRIRLEARWGPLMSPGALRPSGGLVAHAGGLLSALESWGAALVATANQRAKSADPDRQDGAAFGLGAIRAGTPGKADLAPARLEVFAYAVLPGPVDPGVTAKSLANYLRERLPNVDFAVDEQLLGDGPATPATAPIVAAARRAWSVGMGTEPESINDWTGSTDGVVFRAAGVDTARLGPRPLPSPPSGDARADTFELAELVRYARIYEEICLTYLT